MLTIQALQGQVSAKLCLINKSTHCEITKSSFKMCIPDETNVITTVSSKFSNHL